MVKSGFKARGTRLEAKECYRNNFPSRATYFVRIPNTMHYECAPALYAYRIKLFKR
jgi:hypothetical protein